MMFPETAKFVVNYLLSRRPRAPPPHRLDQDSCFYSSRRTLFPPPPSPGSLSLQDYWLSPQRRYLAGSAWRWPTRRLLLLPPSTGLADFESATRASCCGYRPNLMWKYHWQNLNHRFLGKRMRHLIPLYL